ncbi:MAG: COX15/CtaA family protein [Parasphingorhabdus sp.]|uniref:COX15/CtaA family protein n=1 Tax=Parasphingorhabdus sp. TaxID=2709688 RepID=UPI0030027BF8
MMNSSAPSFTWYNGSASNRPVAIANWLLIVAFLVFLMVIVGGITRLTESGLSITEWKPLMGAIPPLSEVAWLSEFEKYKQIPEYIEINGPAGMTLADFKFIYFWEWSHRLLGRLIGLAFALPFFYFAAKRAIPKGYGWRLTLLLILGGLQGVIGWWMVSSGLSQRTDVSHFRLATHLILALFIMACLVWTALDLQCYADRLRKPARMTGFGMAVTLVLFLQLLFGAYVAGLNAGYVANTWPLMNDSFFPAGVDFTFGAWRAINNDPFLTHFIHRWWAWVTVAFLVVLARKVRGESRMASICIHCAFGIQILLGIATVMTGMNIILAVLHQAVGALVVAATAWGIHILGRDNPVAIKS